MLDIRTEQIVSFREATALLPKRRRGRRCHVSTLYRWAQAGCRGVVLETVQIGGQRCTSVEALERFFARLSGAPTAPRPCRPRADVERELDLEGL